MQRPCLIDTTIAVLTFEAKQTALDDALFSCNVLLYRAEFYSFPVCRVSNGQLTGLPKLHVAAAYTDWGGPRLQGPWQEQEWQWSQSSAPAAIFAAAKLPAAFSLPPSASVHTIGKLGVHCPLPTAVPG